MNMVTTSVYPLPYSKEGLTRIHIPRRSDIHCIEVNAVGRSSVCVRTHTVDLEIFVLENFRVLNFRVKIFSWCRIPTKIF